MLRWIGRMAMVGFTIFDFVLFVWASRLAHKFQRLTGRTNFTLAKWSLYTVLLGLIVGTVNAFSPFLSQRDFKWLLPFTLFWPYLVHAEGSKCDRAEQQALSSDQLLMEHFAWMHIGWRMWFLFGSLIGIGQYFQFIHSHYALLEVIDCCSINVGLLGFAYFVMVVPLPPCKGKIRGWLDKLAHRQVPALDQV